ncbi:MAG: carboxymuconolactone decarboxylase family protein [Burkholderiales bacterium]
MKRAIAALAAMGDDDQLDLYLRCAIESGLTRAQITEALTHLGFYAGWPKANKAITAVIPYRQSSDVFDVPRSWYVLRGRRISSTSTSNGLVTPRNR